MVLVNLPFILGSSSPQRLTLLRAVGIDPICILPEEIPYDTPELKADALVKSRASRKLISVDALSTHLGTQKFIVTADTQVFVGRRRLPSARTPSEALDNIILLSGRRHRVCSGVALQLPSGKRVVRGVVTAVTFKRLSTQEMDSYVSSEDWRGVGIYRAQGKASLFIRNMQGLSSTLLGLPMYTLYQILQGSGYSLLEPLPSRFQDIPYERPEEIF